MQEEPVQRWAASGAMALTGRQAVPPLGPPAPLVTRLDQVAELIARRSRESGSEVTVDPLALLAERAAIAGHHRRGRTSCGGGTRLLPTADGWMALCLARPDDVDLLPAWLGVDPPTDDPWNTVEAAVASRRTRAVVEQGAELGLPVSELPTELPAFDVADPPIALLPVHATRVVRTPTDTTARARLDDALVVDLSSLWAGPLCGALLADAGSTVVKVESTRRPDGARRGPRRFFDLLNAGKRSVALDLTTDGGRAALRALLARADVVIEASRPRALRSMGIDAEELLATRPRVWLSITGHGRHGTGEHRVAFGDDAAVAGGLVAWDGATPVFCADAVADPATGLVAAAAAMDALAAGGAWLLDVSLVDVAAWLAGPTLPVPDGVCALPPTGRTFRGVARDIGADTTAVLAELGIRS